MIEDVGDARQELSSVVQEFQERYQKDGTAKLPPTFKQAAHNFLSEHLGEPHAFADFFNAIAAVSESVVDRDRFHDALSLWQATLRVVAEWEDGNRDKPTFRPVHRGTPLYFASGIHFRMGNREHALMVMHLAVEQDERNMPGEYTPARKFIALDADSQEQYLRPIVAALSDFLKARLKWYETFADPLYGHPYGHLTWDEFRQRFLAHGGSLSSVAAYYVFSVARVHSLWPMIDALRDSRFAARLYENAP